LAIKLIPERILDYASFRSSMKVIAPDMMSEQEVREYVEERFERYGAPFLTLCVENKCEPK
jgi:hypothetical protein